MKMNLKALLAGLVLAGTLNVFAGATAGSCMSKAVSLSSQQTVRLVDEYDSDFGGNLGTGVYYFKIKLSRGSQCTIWITGGMTEEMMFSVDTDWDDESAPWAMFDYDYRDDGATQVAYMYADAWDEEDPSSGTYYVCISGEIGDTCTLRYSPGIVTFVKEGEEGNPRRVVATESRQTEIKDQVGNGDFYYSLNLEAGFKYRLWAVGATDPVTLDPEDITDFNYETDPLMPQYLNTFFKGTKVENAVGYFIYPQVTKDYVFNISTKGFSQKVGFLWQRFKTLAPEDHKNKVLLNEGNNYEADIMPGRIGTDLTDYYDPVIDETLCKVAIGQGERWVFQTAGCTNDVMVRVYDDKGAILYENTSLDNVSRDVRAVVKASYSGNYYVGVCDPSLTELMEPESNVVHFVARNTADITDADVDEFDDADDEYAGASMIVAYPGVSTNYAQITTIARPHGQHTLSATDWYDWFCFAGRKGVGYALKADFATDAVSQLGLAGRLYKMVNGKASEVTSWKGSLTPDLVDSGTVPFYFVADEDAMYYLQVTVKEGIGLDYPAYNLYAMAFYDGAKLGLMQVKTKGADGTWSFTNSAERYPGDTFMLVMAGASTKIAFNPVDGFTTPPAVSLVAREWTGSDDDLEVVTGVYNDTFDPGDDTLAHYTLITPSAAAVKAPRTLWKEDPADCFVFRAEAGVYYNFKLDDTTRDGIGDAVFSVYDQRDLDNPMAGCDNILSLYKAKFEGGVYYLVKVHHETDAKADSSYTLSYNSARVGTIQFASTAVKVSEDAPYADLTVTRTSSEGSVAVRYSTVADTAKPGVDYYPSDLVDNMLVWENGDMAPKTIRVRLIPDLKPAWEGGDKRFYVKLAAMPEDTIDPQNPNVFVAQLSGKGVATVTLSESAAIAPGTVSVLDQPLQATAGDAYPITLSRTGGTDGRIAVAVRITPDTAVAGTDYKAFKPEYQIVEWADGEAGEKQVLVETVAKSVVSTKKANLSFMTLNADYTSAGYGDFRDCKVPALDTKSAVLTISSQCAQNQSSVLAQASAAGVGLSLLHGSWYVDEGSRIRSGAVTAADNYVRIGFNVTGPGFLVAEPEIVDAKGGETMLYQVAGGSVVDFTAAGGKQVLTVPAGAQTVLFQLSGKKAGAFCRFKLLDNGLPFKWMPLSSVAAVSPLKGAVLPFGSKDLAWTAPAGWTDESIVYRVKLGLNASSLPYKVTDETSSTSASMTDYYASEIGKIVSKLTIGHSSVFFWNVECAYTGSGSIAPADYVWIASPNVSSFGISAENTPGTLVSGTDALGNVVDGSQVIELVQGVAFDGNLACGGGYQATISGCVGGRLPPGISAANLKLSGVPTTPGEYTALVEVAVGSAYANTRELKFRVAPMGLAQGAFCGALKEVGSATPNAYIRNLGFSLTTDPTGAISASLLYNGGRMTMGTDRGFTEFDEAGSNLVVTLTSEAKYSVKTYTNRIELVLRALPEDEAAQLSGPIGTAKVTLYLPDGDGFYTERKYACDLVRDNSANAAYVEEIAPYVGYYTMVLKPFGPLAGEPMGNGLVVMQLGADGVAKFTGIHADGTSFTCSSFASLETSGPGCYMACPVRIPVWSFGADYSFAGDIRLCYAAETIDGEAANASFVDSTTELAWTKDGASSTFDGTGFNLALTPVGGFYDTVYNLQAYYLDRDFTVEAEPVLGLPEGILPTTYGYTFDTTPHDLEARLEGNSFAVDGTSFVKADNGRYDFVKSVNPWAVTMKFGRGSGLLSGTFKMVNDDGASVQSYIATPTFSGLLLMHRDELNSPLDVDVFVGGHYLLKLRPDWALSMPFNIRWTAVDRDWMEKDVQK